jgi:hypothetical protein
MTEEKLTYGQKAVGITFNPVGDELITQTKQAFANEIDRMNGLRDWTQSPEQKRLCSIAITKIQTAQMWAIKASTWKD